MLAFTVLGLALIAAGCTGFAFVLQPPPKFIELETWTDVPQRQKEVKAKVGEVLHLPVGPASEHLRPSLLMVSINGKAPECPEFYQSSKTDSYVFRAEKAGVYNVEVGPALVTGEGESDLTWKVVVME
jgi:hypothetical protein